MREVTLEEILRVREERVIRQKEFLSQYNCPLICFTMNIAGPVKHSPLIERAFYEGVRLLKKVLPQEKITDCKLRISYTGCEMLMAIDEDSTVLKELCTKIEEDSPLGRLFDMDVINKNGEKLTRTTERGCIVCGAEGRGCSARRLHSASELWEITQKIICNHFKEADRDKFAIVATESLIKEARTTPKPGLVDMDNNGSHKDMDLEMFIKSANALTPYFRKCIEIGQNFADKPDGIFPELRREGFLAEQTMYEATDGVNTHKGAIYSMGIICGALGCLWTAEKEVLCADEIFSMCSRITKEAVNADFQNIDYSTAGGRLYLEKGIKGIRGEVSEGFPSVKNISLPTFKKALSEGFSENDSAVFALLHLIENVEDTNILSRGGEEGSIFAKSVAKELLSKSPFPDLKEVVSADKRFIEKNLSPGGCADLLAVTYFIYEITNEL